MRYTIDNALVD